MQKWDFQVGAQARGWADSLEWSVGSGLGADCGSMARGAGGSAAGPGRLVRQPGRSLPIHRYRLEESFAVTLSDSAPAISPLTLRAEDGSGVIQLGGRVPGSEGSLAVRMLGLDLQDVYGLLQRDTSSLAGEVGLDVRFGGTAQRRPSRHHELGRPSSVISSPRLSQGVVDYADRRLEANLLLWRTGENVLQVESQFPSISPSVAPSSGR